MPIYFKDTRQANLQASDVKFIHVDEDTDTRIQQRDLSERVRLSKIECVPIDLVRPNKRNTRKHSQRQIDLLTESIRKFGFTQPIVVDEGDNILCGHAKVKAAFSLGITVVPVIRLSHLSNTEKKALAIADNKLAELGEWDLSMLSEELVSIDLDETIDINSLGFDTAEIDDLLVLPEDRPGQADPADAINYNDDADGPVSQDGDIWLCNKHRLLCGSSLENADYQNLMNGERASIVITDPPYNVPNKHHVSSRADVREFAMARGEMSPQAFTDFLHKVCICILQYANPGAVAYICMDWRHIVELQSAASPAFGPLRNLIVWVKTNAGMGSFYRSQHELVFVYVMPGGKPTNNFRLGGRGRYRTNVWQYAGFNTFGRDRDDTLATHPTVKPVAMIADALRDCSNRGDIVLDPFGGSGTTMIAAERTGRHARLIEIDPIYCDLTVKRWEQYSKSTARLAETNETFDEVRSRRRSAQVARGM